MSSDLPISKAAVDPQKLALLHPGNICGSVSAKGMPCRRRAGWGTNHYGEGRCRMHEGNESITEIVTVNRREYLVGMVEPHLRARLIGLLEDPNLLSCRAELALLKLKFEQLLVDGMEVISNDGSVEVVEATLGAISSLVGLIIKNTKIIHDMEMTKRHYIHVSVAAAIVEAFAELSRKYVKDPISQKQLENDMIKVLRDAFHDNRAIEMASSFLDSSISPESTVL